MELTNRLKMASSDVLKIVAFQLCWWTVDTLGFITTALLDPDNPAALQGLHIFPPIWFVTGLVPSSILFLWSHRLTVPSWHPVKQLITAFAGAIVLAPAHF